MTGLVTQINTISAGNTILNNATRATNQFKNQADSLLAELAAWEATLPAAGLDAATTAEIATLKADTIASIKAQLATIQTALDNA